MPAAVTSPSEMTVEAFNALQDNEEPYHILTVDDVVAYAERTLPLWLPTRGGAALRPGEIVSSEEVGDGNLNLVFRLLNAQGKSVAVLKQALPYVRCVGESWPLTVDRNRLEAETLLAHYPWAPEVTERVLFHSTAMSVLVLEDLSDCVIWRRELVRGHHHAHVAPALGSYLASVHFYTSDLHQDPGAKKHAVQRVTNVDMCRITEDLFFTDPFIVHARNNYEAPLEALVQDLLRNNGPLKLRVAQLKHAFLCRPEAHIHGDVHTGSVFVDATRVRAIDAEFGFYGPMGFDVGSVVGNLLLSYVALEARQRQRQQQPEEDGKDEGEGPASREPADLTSAVPLTHEGLLGSVAQLWGAYAEGFGAHAAADTRDAAFRVEGYAATLLRQVWADAVGFAGAELIRRTIGLAHVADLDGIRDDAARLRAKESALRLGAELILGAAGLGTTEELFAVVRPYATGAAQ